MRTPKKDLTGRQFGRLTVLFWLGRNIHGHNLWLCACKCGKSCRPTAGDLLNGDSTSCGCRRTESVSLACSTHGQSRGGYGGKESRAYTSWRHMLERALNPNNAAWENYGGRGIKVCDRWLTFENFFADMGPRPAGLTLDRTDNEKGYEPGNCRWTDRQTQNLNRRIRADNETGVACVQIVRGNRYRVRSLVNGVRTHLGYYPLTSAGLQAATEVVKKAKQIQELFS